MAWTGSVLGPLNFIQPVKQRVLWIEEHVGAMGPPKGLRAAELWWGCRSVQHRALTAVTEQPPLTASSALMRWPIAPGHRDGV